MKITFVLPQFNLSGGVRAAATYANIFANMGHDVHVIAPRTRNTSTLRRLFRFLKTGKRQAKTVSNFSYFQHTSAQVTEFEYEDFVQIRHLTDSDFIIATWWETVEWVSGHPKHKIVHFVQDHEVFEHLPQERTKAVLSLPINKICVANWLTRTMIQDYGSNELRCITVANGVDSTLFYPLPKQSSAPRFGFLYSTAPRKNIKLAIQALEISKQRVPDLQVSCFGSKPPSDSLTLPDWFDFTLKPNPEVLNEIYNSCNAWLFTSTSEGFGLPILEALSCATPVIATKAGAAPDLITNANGWLLESFDVTELVDKIIAVSQMERHLWEEYSASALETGKANDWNSSAKLFIEQLDYWKKAT